MASGILFVENLTVIQIPIEQIVEVSYWFPEQDINPVGLQ
jgi:hypothetical protein